jgi:glycosyltransferase involved in cell wall biosynthesis
MSKAPLITIGVPAFNSAAHIGLTLEGLLSQSFSDFELIVSDNASTDGTREIVEGYIRRDARVRYERQPFNIGANPNYAVLVTRARGQFFKWSSASDWCAPTFLERCKNELVTHEDVVLAVPRTRLFQKSLQSSVDYPDDIEVLDDTPYARLVRLTSTLALNNAMNGLIRTAALRRTRLMERYIGADCVLMGHLALLGKFRLIEEPLFYRRMEPETATASQDRAALWRHHYPRLSRNALFQGSKRQMGWLRVALTGPMPAGERMRSLTLVAKMCYWERAFLLRDLSDLWHYCTQRSWPK